MLRESVGERSGWPPSAWMPALAIGCCPAPAPGRCNTSATRRYGINAQKQPRAANASEGFQWMGQHTPMERLWGLLGAVVWPLGDAGTTTASVMHPSAEVVRGVTPDRVSFEAAKPFHAGRFWIFIRVAHLQLHFVGGAKGAHPIASKRGCNALLLCPCAHRYREPCSLREDATLLHL